MKYVSPQTEKRKQQQKKRKKQLALCVCIAAAAVVLFVAVFALTGRDEKPQSSSQTDSELVQNSQEQQPSSDTQNNSSSDEHISSDEGETESEQSPQEEQTPQSATKPKKKKKSIFARIGSIFSKEEVVEEVFPAMSFGVQVSQAADSIISLSPMATEIILSSPSQHSLVAVSEYCNKRGTELMTVGTPL
ncbi:MAG: hypothetical protein J6K30_02690, partial [Oscillospiraceae bacterium]|nr:hypothetical protein [Oscillospiraceae bacterium]